MTVKSRRILQLITDEQSGTSHKAHHRRMDDRRTSGVTSNKQDKIASGSTSVAAGVPVSLDLAGGLTDVDGDAITFADVTRLYVEYESGTGTLVIGGGSNDVSTLWLATGDGCSIGPGGAFLWESPENGAAVTAGTADLLRFVSGSGTVGFYYQIEGRSS